MSVDSITGNTAAFQIQHGSAGSLDKPVKSPVASDGLPDKVPLKSSALASDINTAADNIIKSKQQTAVKVNSNEPTGVVSHVVQSYNQQGKLRTKFEDSRNNVVYQIPSEMTSKLEDQLLAANTSTNIKA